MRRLLAVALVAVALSGCKGEESAAHQGTPAASPTGGRVLKVFLRTDATEPQKQTIFERLKVQPGVVAVRYETRDEAYRRFREEFKDSPALLEGARPESFADSWLAVLAVTADCPAIVAQVTGLPGVDAAPCPP